MNCITNELDGSGSGMDRLVDGAVAGCRRRFLQRRFRLPSLPSRRIPTRRERGRGKFGIRFNWVGRVWPDIGCVGFDPSGNARPTELKTVFNGKVVFEKKE